MSIAMRSPRAATVKAGAVVAGALVAGGLGLAPVANAATYNTLTPGVGISDRLTIGMSRATVVNSLGASQCSTASSCNVGNAGSGGYVTIHFYKGAVEALEFENQSGYYTKQGVTPTSTLSAVAAAYGVPVKGNVAAAVSKGYAAKQINDYSCSDSGCRVSGSHLRHIIFTPGDATRTQNVSDGSIVLKNTTRNWGFISGKVVVKNSSGTVVGTKQVSMYLAPGASMTYKPGDLFDLTAWKTGTYTYTVNAKAGGTFTVKATDVNLF